MNTEQQKKRKQAKLKQIGDVCSWYRKHENLKIRDVANETGYSTSLIYQFEKGNSSNLLILFDCYLMILKDSDKLLREIKELLK